MGLFIQPLEGSELTAWSFPLEPLEKKMGPPYFIYYSYALNNRALKFTLEFEVTLRSFYWLIHELINIYLQSESNNIRNFEVGVIGHLTHHQRLYNDEFKEFLKSFPKWTYVANWMSSYESWIF